MARIVRLPDLPVGDLCKFDSREGEAHASTDIERLRVQRLVVCEVLVLDVGRQGGLDWGRVSASM